MVARVDQIAVKIISTKYERTLHRMSMNSVPHVALTASITHDVNLYASRAKLTARLLTKFTKT